MTDGPGFVIIAVVLLIGLLKIFRGPVGAALAVGCEEGRRPGMTSS